MTKRYMSFTTSQMAYTKRKASVGEGVEKLVALYVVGGTAGRYRHWGKQLGAS